MLEYQRTALDAYRETSDALFAYLSEHERRATLGAAVEQAEHAVGKSESLYREGLVDFQSVLDNQRTLFELEDDLAVSEADVARRLIDLFRTLGGGWEATLPEDAASP